MTAEELKDIRNALKKAQIKYEEGRSMVEMLGVLAIVGVISIGGIAGYTYGMNRYRTNELLDGASKRAYTVATQLASEIPPNLSEFAEFDVTAGGTFSSSVTEWEGGEFGLTVSGVSKPVCENLIQMIGENTPLRAIAKTSAEDTDLRLGDCSSEENVLYMIYNTDMLGADYDSERECGGTGCGECGCGCTPGTRQCLGARILECMTGSQNTTYWSEVDDCSSIPGYTCSVNTGGGADCVSGGSECFTGGVCSGQDGSYCQTGNDILKCTGGSWQFDHSCGCGECGCGETGCGETGCGETGCGQCGCGDGSYDHPYIGLGTGCNDGNPCSTDGTWCSFEGTRFKCYAGSWYGSGHSGYEAIWYPECGCGETGCGETGCGGTGASGSFENPYTDLGDICNLGSSCTGYLYKYCQKWGNVYECCGGIYEGRSDNSPQNPHWKYVESR